MSHFDNRAFQTASLPGSGFNLVTQTNSFSSVFDPRPLDAGDACRIEKLLADNFMPGRISEEQVGVDAIELKQITAEIKAIGKQSIILMGERVYRASNLLKPYKDGTFTKWLEATFGSKKTGYNALSYYNLFNELPSEDLRHKFKMMPQKPAYILASRQGCDLDVKAEIVREYHDMDPKQLVSLIQERIPKDSKDRRTLKSSNERLISVMRSTLRKLKERADELSEEDKSALAELIPDISFLSGR